MQLNSSTRLTSLQSAGLLLAIGSAACAQGAPYTPTPAVDPAPASPELIAKLKALRTAPAPVAKTADGTAVPQTITTPSGKQMALQFHDEFDAVPDTKTDGQPYIDRRKWKTTFWQGSGSRTLGGNGEAQYYMDKDYAGRDNIALEKRPNPFSFEKPGVLTISATKTPKDLWGNYWMGEQRPFSSGMIISDAKFVFQYGYVEGRFKLPKNRGAWPAFWLLPNNPGRGEKVESHHPWPPEIDIFEAFGHSPNRFTVNIHAPKTEKTRVSKFAHEFPEDLTADFHTWAMEWNADKVIYFFDGKEIATAPVTSSFRQPMYLLINLAVGGNWYTDEMKALKTPYKAWEVDEASMPWKMDVDYVRVYQSPDNLIPSPYIPPAVAAPAAAPATGAPAAGAPATALPASTGNGPTPYPNQKAWEDSVWPGKGPIRTFGWMVDNRKAFWAAREKDQGAVVFAGDSNTAGWKGLPEAFPGLKVANRGIGGDVSRGLLFRWKEDVLDLNPRAINILIGGNDLSAHADPAGIEHNIRLMIQAARAHNPKVPIILTQLAPRESTSAPTKPGALADLNARIANIGKDFENVAVVDLNTPLSDANGKQKSELFGADKIHMAPGAYQVWAEQLRPVLEKLGVK